MSNSSESESRHRRRSESYSSDYSPRPRRSRWDEKPTVVSTLIDTNEKPDATPALISNDIGIQNKIESLPDVKPGERAFFEDALIQRDESELSSEERKKIQLKRLLLRIKNGTPAMRKQALRQLTERTKEFGAEVLFEQILPLLMSITLEQQERHILVKVVNRIIFKLDSLVRPFTAKLLVVITPLLDDADFIARVEGREIISNLAKAAGLQTMIAAMRPDIDSPEESIRNTTARAFSVVAAAIGIPSLLPFLKAVCGSKKSWYARHTGLKCIQQIAILMGCSVLPHLSALVAIVFPRLNDIEANITKFAALAIAALAEASYPYGGDVLEQTLEPIIEGCKRMRGRLLASYIKAAGQVISVVDEEIAAKYGWEIIRVVVREFKTSDEEMKKIVLKVIRQCLNVEIIGKETSKNNIAERFFESFWHRRNSVDKKLSKEVIETALLLSQKMGAKYILEKIVVFLKDENEPFRKMTLKAMEKVIQQFGIYEIDEDLEKRIFDGLTFAFIEQTSGDENAQALQSISFIMNCFSERVVPYLEAFSENIKWRFHNKSPKIRQCAVEILGNICGLYIKCNQKPTLIDLCEILYELLGESNTEVLASTMITLKEIISLCNLEEIRPSISDLVPGLTPILRNTNERIEEACIGLIGIIAKKSADTGAEMVHLKEWMRICHELLDAFKAHKKSIRRATVDTFGDIAKAIGPQEVLIMLLNNLKVLDRQLRVCTTIAIAVVADSCAPFTVIPSLMNEYRMPDINIKTGVLKAFAFLFEYIGEKSKDYIYPVIPLLCDALAEKDAVHRQTACTVVKFISLGIYGLGCEDALIHMLNYVWPNIFETSPHVINATLEALEGIRVSLGVLVLMQYVLQGLFHPARHVREPYWRVYNNMYIGNQDGLVAAYPVLEDDEYNMNRRYELEILL
ncbi:splicing factor 3B subunit 1, putative [Entamoeba histolytica HM-1:IMSS]|uniref:Splicing factor 3B subunit 1, putative n=1 Tax=Entamoeba histolytica (strain ATCC 30459 / HM-1:IMSS / ABRM) TaxID=294381 RepID=C4MAD8_ENTH1|nr:splicing factor 3B subunit 1, putative [Entamoeba histolytica HM-1:IMSS]EAL42479.2 splicing factor 3B subunit 1, putative [Entamoeba histolytica HM-1:IMSS]|eukprot:XP_647865.2 splicing factor 3B subunit 1, putative [Entamoeba histolytica HM-1:IMSS]